MKTVNKIIMFSYVLCYFVGVYFISLKFGLLKALSRYGISEVFNEIPKSFPEMKYLYYGILIFTVIYIVIGIWLNSFLKDNQVETEVMQAKVFDIRNYVEEINDIARQYAQLDVTGSISQQKVVEELKYISRMVAALPTSTLNSQNTRTLLEQEIARLRKEIDSSASDKLSATRSFKNVLAHIKSTTITIR